MRQSLRLFGTLVLGLGVLSGCAVMPDVMTARAIQKEANHKEMFRNWAGALADYRQAEAMLSTQLADTPDKDVLEIELIAVYRAIGSVLVRMQRLDDAMKAFDQSVAVAKTRLAQAPLDVMRIRSMVDAYQGIAIGMFPIVAGDDDSTPRDIMLSAYIAAADVIEAAAERNGGRPPELYKYSGMLDAATSLSDFLGRQQQALALAQRRGDGLIRMGATSRDIALALRDASRLYLFAGDFHRAKRAAQAGLELDPDLDELRRVLAHAAMFLNDRRFFQAMHEVRGHRLRKDRAQWHLAVLQDFKELRARGQTTYFMAEVEAILAPAKPTGWSNASASYQHNVDSKLK